MHKTNAHILCTAPVEESLIEKIRNEQTHIDITSFISIKPINDQTLSETINKLQAENINVVFTSNNAVDAIANYINNKPLNWKIFCIGEATKKSVINYFGELSIAGTALNAAELAKEILKHNEITNVVFFCGDIRRDELPTILRKANVLIEEIVVYHTVLTPQKVEKNYDAVLFFSPSAVESFFSVNDIKSTTVLFAIGNTTATSIKKFTGNKIIISEAPTKEQLIDQLLVYYTQTTISN
ncbi:MAG TPA: uroporphyrinogen-III synthase [Flavipsychrobacter sp.]|nr:uroporphyrinogen-III synthase [Flavipsychrobacter sp.]